MTKLLKLFICVLLVILTTIGCTSRWEIAVNDSSGNLNTITKKSVGIHIDNSVEEVESIPLGQLLYASGFSLIDQIKITDQYGIDTIYNWDDISEYTTINESGVILIEDVEITADIITVSESPLLNEISYSIMDISPTAASVLGLPALSNAQGQNVILENENWNQVVMILMDGVQYEKFSTMVNDGFLPFFKNQDNINMGLTVYPPITTSATAALLTGTNPEQNGVFGYGYRSTELTTLFDLAVNNGLSVVAVEGASLPFNLRNAETILSGDKDGNGFSDDNVLSNSLEIIQNKLPDLLYIHFHEVDDMGHSYGENSMEYEDALIRVDNYIEQIYQSLPEYTLIIIFADHGMHTTSDGGNHGTLTAHDLIIPIIFITK